MLLHHVKLLTLKRVFQQFLSEEGSSCSLGFGPCEGAFPDLRLQLIAFSGEDSLL